MKEYFEPLDNQEAEQDEIINPEEILENKQYAESSIQETKNHIAARKEELALAQKKLDQEIVDIRKVPLEGEDWRIRNDRINFLSGEIARLEESLREKKDSLGELGHIHKQLKVEMKKHIN